MNTLQEETHVTVDLRNSYDLFYRYTYGNGEISVVYGEDSIYASFTKLFYHTDRLGSTRFLTDNYRGDVIGGVNYSAWGELTHGMVIRGDERELDLMRKFTGHQYDAVLGIYYARARMYDAQDRRFVSVDPVRGSVIEPATMVQYVYVLDNPVRYTDPLGLATDYEETQAVFALLDKYNFEETSITTDTDSKYTVILTGIIGTYSVAFSINIVNSLIDSGTIRTNSATANYNRFTVTWSGGNPGAEYFEKFFCTLRAFDTPKNSKGREVTIPQTVSGVFDGKPVSLSPRDNWGGAGGGQYAGKSPKDARGRYIVAVGPKIINPNYPDNGKLWRLDDDPHLKEHGKDIDVVLKHKTTGETKTIECVVGDLKAHSYNKYPDGDGHIKDKNYDAGRTASYTNLESGLIQTGIRYPYASNATLITSEAPQYIHVIEFCSSTVDFTTSDYRLEKIIVLN